MLGYFTSDFVMLLQFLSGYLRLGHFKSSYLFLGHFRKGKIRFVQVRSVISMVGQVSSG
jgi:hypothetical protein